MWLAAVLFSLSAFAKDFPRVEAEWESLQAELRRIETDFAREPARPADKAWVKKKLTAMSDVDQKVRGLFSKPPAGFSREEVDAWMARLAPELHRLDRKNTADLKSLLEKREWFTISEFGAAADDQAWTIVQHADADREFQKRILPRLEKLWPRGETKPSNYALLFDRVAVSWNDPSLRQPQRYGTQGECKGPGVWEPLPIENPAGLEARRRTLGLPPMAEYTALIKTFCPK